MMPPLLRRCPDCGHVTLAGRFVSVDDDPRVVACPVCGYRFRTVDEPRLN